MMYDEETKNMICDRSKDVTRRLYNPNRRPAIPGTRHKIKIDRTKMVYGEINILSCTPQRWGDLTEEDARREGFSSRAAYREYFYAINGFIQDDDLVWVIEFNVVWTHKQGVILEAEEYIRSLPPRFREEARDVFYDLNGEPLSTDLNVIDKAWSYYIIEVVEDMTEKERKRYGW